MAGKVLPQGATKLFSCPGLPPLAFLVNQLVAILLSSATFFSSMDFPVLSAFAQGTLLLYSTLSIVCPNPSVIKMLSPEFLKLRKY